MTPRELFVANADLGREVVVPPAIAGEQRREWHKGDRLIIASVGPGPIAMISLSHRGRDPSQADYDELLVLAIGLDWRRVSTRTFAAELPQQEKQ